MSEYPSWPLPLDWRPAVNSPKLLENQCDRCKQILLIEDNKARHFRKHQRGLKCRRGAEMVAMNAKGLHVISTKGKGYFDNALKPLAVSGEHYVYYPAPVVSWLRWRHPSGAVHQYAPKGFSNELAQFVALPESEQIAILVGAVLEYEYKEEAKHEAGQELGDKDIPF